MTNTLFDIPAIEIEKPSKVDLYPIPDDWEPEVLASTGEKLTPIINQDRVDLVLGTLLEAYSNNEFPYNLEKSTVPHAPENMPKTLVRGGVEHANFLWAACYYMRGGIKSVDAFKRLARVYDGHPELFEWDVAAEKDPVEIAAILKEHKLGLQNDVSEEWVENAKRMQALYGGDPRKIFTGIQDYEDSLRLIKNDDKGNGFIGFGPKMTSMILYYLMDEGLIDFFNFPIPVDLHVTRLSLATGMVEFPDAPHGTNLRTEENLAKLREIYFNYARDNGVDPITLCNAVWLMSEAICGINPGNITEEKHGREARKGRTTYLTPLEVNPNDPAQQAAYEASCRNCPIEEHCELNIPGKHNYVSGAIIIRGRRLRFPLPAQSSFFD